MQGTSMTLDQTNIRDVYTNIVSEDNSVLKISTNIPNRKWTVKASTMFLGTTPESSQKA